MQKLRVGVIGTGMAFGRLHYPAYMELQDKFEIAALSDTKVEKAREWANKLNLSEDNVFSDYREMMKSPDLDMFDILVPIGLNFTVIDDVAKAGKPIICEKPLAPNMEEAAAMRDLPRKYNVLIMIAENYRYNEEINMIKDMLRTEKLGKPVYFMQNRVMNFPQDMLENKFAAKEWRQHPNFPGGAVLDTGVHDIAALRHIFGPIDEVHAFGVPQNDEFAPYAVITANFRFRSGLIGQFSFYSAGQEPQRPLVGLRIFCGAGMIFLEERDCGTINATHYDGRSEQISYRPQRGFYNELLNFYKAAVGKEQLSVTPELEFGDAKTVFDMIKSIREKRPIRVDEIKEDVSVIPTHPLEDKSPRYLM